VISIEKEFLFVHVPKTGGNSIQSLLLRYSEDQMVMPFKYQDGIERFGIRNQTYSTIRKHSTLADYQSVMEEPLFRSLFKFANIRNPWDRVISFYFSPNRGFTKWDRESCKNLIHNMRTLREYVYVPSLAENFGSQLNLRNSSDLMSNIDCLIRFEHIDLDFKAVCKKLNIVCQKLPKRNSSLREHYSKYYDDELKLLVAQKFSEEIEIGEYQFEKI